MSLNNAAAAGPVGPSGPRINGPLPRAGESTVWGSGLGDELARSTLGELFRDGAWTDLVAEAIATPRSPVLEALVDLRFRYTVAHRLPGSLHFDDDLPDVEVPAAPLRSILEHLVEGALRSNPASSPYCHVGVHEQTEDRVVLSIRDNGIDLPECALDDLRRFVESNTVSHVPDRVYRLFLADTLVQWLGGRLRVAPSPNGSGATIHLELPKKSETKPKGHPLVGRHVF